VIGAEDDDRADASLGQQLHRRGKIGARDGSRDIPHQAEFIALPRPKDSGLTLAGHGTS
jgi:hypothetical protein